MKKLLIIPMCMILMLTMALPVSAASTKAATMTLGAVEGTVTVKNAAGKAVTTREGMSLYSGYSLETAEKSYAYFSLDDTKIIKMDALSSVRVKKSGKKLELQLKNGEVLVDVTEPLKKDESLSVRTSTMVTGVRGTLISCYSLQKAAANMPELKDAAQDTVRVEGVKVYEGSVLTRAVTGSTGAVDTCRVEAGQHLRTITSAEPLDLSGGQKSKTAALRLEKLTEADVGGSVAMAILESPELQQRIAQAGTLNVSELVAGAAARLEKEQSAAEAVLKDPQQGRIIVTEPVFAIPVYDVVEIPVTVVTDTAGLTRALTSGDTDIRLARSLTVDSALTIPAASTVTVQKGVTLTLGENAVLTVQGKLIAASGARMENPSSAAMINVNGTLKIAEGASADQLQFYAGKGSHVFLYGTVTGASAGASEGTLTCSGQLSGQYAVKENGTINVTGGTVSASGTEQSDKPVLECCGGTLNISGGTVDGTVYSDGATVISGGTFRRPVSQTGGSLTVRGGAFCGDMTELAEGQYAYRPAICGENCDMDISGGTFRGCVNPEDRSEDGEQNRAIEHRGSGTLRISGTATVVDGNVVHFPDPDDYDAPEQSEITQTLVRNVIELSGSPTVTGSIRCESVTVPEDGTAVLEMLTITGGTITGDVMYTGMPVMDEDTAYIGGVELSGASTVITGSVTSAGSIAITGGTLHGYALCNSELCGSLKMTGGAVYNDSTDFWAVGAYNEPMTLTGGSLYGGLGDCEQFLIRNADTDGTYVTYNDVSYQAVSCGDDLYRIDLSAPVAASEVR